MTSARKGMVDALRDSKVREAIFLGSPDLYSRLASARYGCDREMPREIERAVYRYLARMSSRCTPFGLFAGCSLGSVNTVTNMKIPDCDGNVRYSRIDMEYLNDIATGLSRDPNVLQDLVLSPNNSLYRIGKRFHYIECRKSKGERTYQLVALDSTSFLEKVLHRASKGMTASELAASVVKNVVGISLEEAWEYVCDLVANEVLVPGLMPTITGAEPIEALINSLKHLQGEGARAALAGLEKARRRLAYIDEAGLGVDVSQYQEIAETLKGLPAEVKMPHLVQVDLIKPAGNLSISTRITGEILRGVDILNEMMPLGSTEILKRFQAAFVERYQAREVPLVEVLDDEIGLGFESSSSPSSAAEPLLAGVSFPKKSNEPSSKWTRRQVCLLEILGRARKEQSLEYELTPSDIEDLRVQANVAMPDAFAALASIAASSDESIKSGHYKILLHGAHGPSGARMLGRFCHADKELHKAVEWHLRAEESLAASAIFAEIVHQPEGRTGNVLHRPCVRDYEIPFLGHSGAPIEKQIPITDLMISVRKGNIHLRSNHLNKEVLPRLTSAHNFSMPTSLKLYKFLCLLQSQNRRAGVRWNWGGLERAAFLPRISYGKLVFSRAQWRLDVTTIKSLAQLRDFSRFAKFQDWGASNKLPRFVALKDGDKELLVDRNSPIGVDTLIEHIRTRGTALLVEMFPDPDELCCKGPEGKFVHEIVVPFVRKSDGAAGNQGSASGDTSERNIVQIHTLVRKQARTVQRVFVPGSEWLYAKLYVGPAYADRLLREVVAPILGEVQASGAVDRWFFIRYGDPEWHLRMRFHGQADRLMKEITPLLHNRIADSMESKLVWRIQYDSYVREIERYGGPGGIELCERLFHYDSQAVLKVLALFTGDVGADARWKLALAGVDRLLSDLGMDLQAKHALLLRLRDAFAEEFKVDGPFKKSVSKRFRAERPFLDQLLDREDALQTNLAPGLRLFEERAKAWAPVMQDLVQQEKKGRLSNSIPGLAGSLVHMHLNRMLRSAQRAHEVILYQFLAQLYGSKIVRAAKGSARTDAPSSTQLRAHAGND